MVKGILVLFSLISFQCGAGIHASSKQYDLLLSPATNELIITYLPSMKTDRLCVPQNAKLVCLFDQTAYVVSGLGSITAFDLETKERTGSISLPDNINDLKITPNRKLIAVCGTHTFKHSRATKVADTNKLVLFDKETLTPQSHATLSFCPSKIYFDRNHLILLNTINESITVLTLGKANPATHVYVGNWPTDMVFHYNKVFISTVLGIKILNRSFNKSTGFILTTTPITRLKIEGHDLIAAHRCTMQRYNTRTHALISETPHSSALTLDYFSDYLEMIPADDLDPKIQVTDHGFVRMAVYPLTPKEAGF